MLTEILYAELRTLAWGLLQKERRDHTLQATALVHEAWLRLADQSRAMVRSRSHFLALAATVLKRILIDHARARKARKRGHGRARLALDDQLAIVASQPVDLLDLETALAGLAALDARATQVVELRIFGGLTIPEVARVLDVSTRTVEKDWRMACAWLKVKLGNGSTGEGRAL